MFLSPRLQSMLAHLSSPSHVRRLAAVLPPTALPDLAAAGAPDALVEALAGRTRDYRLLRQAALAAADRSPRLALYLETAALSRGAPIDKPAEPARRTRPRR